MTDSPAPAGAVHRVAVISDTHGLLRPSVAQALRGYDLILHAGDVGTGQVLDDLRAIAPLRAVRGNVDRSGRLGMLPHTELVDVGGPLVYMLHVLEDLDLDPERAGVSAVIYGHTHRPKIEHRGGILFLNPGSVGPRRFDLPVTMADLSVDEGVLRARLIELDD